MPFLSCCFKKKVKVKTRLCFAKSWAAKKSLYHQCKGRRIIFCFWATCPPTVNRGLLHCPRSSHHYDNVMTFLIGSSTEIIRDSQRNIIGFRFTRWQKIIAMVHIQWLCHKHTWHYSYWFAGYHSRSCQIFISVCCRTTAAAVAAAAAAAAPPARQLW